MLEKGIFAYDAETCRSISESFSFGGQLPPMPGPFNERILLPIIAKYVSAAPGLRLIDAYSWINALSAFGTAWIILMLLGKLEAKPILRMAGPLLFLVLWNAPLRSAFFHPGMPFGFDTLMVSLMTYTLFLVATQSRTSIPFILLTASIFFAGGLQRGVITLTLPFVPLLLNYVTDSRSAKKLLFPFGKRLFSPYVLFVAFAAAGLLLAKGVTIATDDSDYSIGMAILHSLIYKNLHLLEFLYPFYYSAGPFFLILVTLLLLPEYRRKFLRQLAEKPELRLVLGFVLLGMVLASSGGGDSDRFVLWFAPWFIALASPAFNLIPRRALAPVGIFLIVIALLWARPFIPSFPPMIFSNEINTLGAATNFDDGLYRGVGFIKRFRNEMQPVTLTAQKEFAPDCPIQSGLVHPSVLYNPERPATAPHSHRMRINNIPFPLGYLHNQRDLLVDHPFVGKKWVKYFLVAQWLGCQILLTGYLWRHSKPPLAPSGKSS